MSDGSEVEQLAKCELLPDTRSLEAGGIFIEPFGINDGGKVTECV